MSFRDREGVEMPQPTTQGELPFNDLTLCKTLEWLVTLREIPGYVPDLSRDITLIAWAKKRSLPFSCLVDTAEAMLAKLVYNPGRNRWESNGRYYANLRATFMVWAKRQGGTRERDDTTEGYLVTPAWVLEAAERGRLREQASRAAKASQGAISGAPGGAT